MLRGQQDPLAAPDQHRHLSIRLPGSELLLQHQDEPPCRGYTPLFIKTDAGEHVLEALVTARETPRAQPRRSCPAPSRRSLYTYLVLADRSQIEVTGYWQAPDPDLSFRWSPPGKRAS